MCSLTAHPAANRYLVKTAEKLKAAMKGIGHPSSLCQRPRLSALSLTGTPRSTESYMELTFTFTFKILKRSKSTLSGMGDHIDWKTYDDALKIAKEEYVEVLLKIFCVIRCLC